MNTDTQLKSGAKCNPSPAWERAGRGGEPLTQLPQLHRIYPVHSNDHEGLAITPADERPFRRSDASSRLKANKSRRCVAPNKTFKVTPEDRTRGSSRIFLNAGHLAMELQLGGNRHIYLNFHYLLCDLKRLSAVDYQDSDNVVARLNLPNMQYGLQSIANFLLVPKSQYKDGI
jgi:hypothetical protein